MDTNDWCIKPVLSGHSKIDKIKVLKTNGSLMTSKVLQNALLEHSAILLTCIMITGLEKQFLVFFLSGSLRRVLLYKGTILQRNYRNHFYIIPL